MLLHDESPAAVEEREKAFLLGTYARTPFHPRMGKGAKLIDAHGREYWDLLGGIAVNVLGHRHPRLIKTLRLRRPDVVGWSMGGMIAQSLAVRHPKSLRRLVLMATAPGDGKGVPPTPAALGTLTGTADPTALREAPRDRSCARG